MAISRIGPPPELIARPSADLCVISRRKAGIVRPTTIAPPDSARQIRRPRRSPAKALVLRGARPAQRDPTAARQLATAACRPLNTDLLDPHPLPLPRLCASVALPHTASRISMARGPFTSGRLTT